MDTTQEKIINLLSKSPLGIVSRALNKGKPRIILAYHGIHPTHPSCVTPTAFLKQILLIRKYYKIVPIGQIIKVHNYDNEKPLLSLTFDDSYINLLEYAFPILFELNIPAAVYVPSNYIGLQNGWDKNRSEPLMLVMTSEELRDIHSRGIEIGSHTVNHTRLKGLKRSILINEIIDSKKALEDLLDSNITTFSYPYGGRNDYDNYAVEIVKEAGYKSAVTGNFGRYNSIENRYQLNRVTIWPKDTIEIFIAKINGYYDWVSVKELIVYYMRRLVR